MKLNTIPALMTVLAVSLLAPGAASADDDDLEVVRVELASRHEYRIRSGIDVRTYRDVPVIIASFPWRHKPARRSAQGLFGLQSYPLPPGEGARRAGEGSRSELETIPALPRLLHERPC